MKLSQMLVWLFGFCVVCAEPECYGQSGGRSGTMEVPHTSDLGTPVADTGVKNVYRQPDADSLAFVSKKLPFQPNPKKAGLYSSIVPGLGQCYNRQYWKIPIIYAGAAVAGYYFVKNLNDYQSYRIAYISRINNPYYTDKYANIYSTSQLQQLQSDYNKYLDLTVLFSTLGYAMQVIDAVTSAHLKNFDISRDISLRIRPVATPAGLGMALVVNQR